MPHAEPILASALWASQLASTPPNPRTKIATGHHNIDTALSGGLSYGSITTISADASCGAQELSLALLVSHLLACKENVATVIDSTLTFDVRALHQRLTLKLRAGSGGGGATRWKSNNSASAVHRNRFFGRSRTPHFGGDDVGLMENGMADIPEMPSRVGSSNGGGSNSHLDPRSGMVSSAAWREEQHPLAPRVEDGERVLGRSRTDDLEMRRLR